MMMIRYSAIDDGGMRSMTIRCDDGAIDDTIDDGAMRYDDTIDDDVGMRYDTIDDDDVGMRYDQ